jgi:hypothetical protein
MSLNGNAENCIELRGSLSIPDTIRGKSAYEIAVYHGFDGTEEEWLAHLEAAQSESLKNASEQAQTEIESNRQTALSDIEKAKATMLEEIELAAEIVQTVGDSTTAVMSQKAVTDMLMHTVIRASELSWEQGVIYNGYISASETRITSERISVNTADKRVQFVFDSTTYDIGYATYDETGNFLADTSWLVYGQQLQSPIKVTLADNAASLRIYVRRMNNAAITPDEDTGLMFVRCAIEKGVGTSDKFVASQRVVKEIAERVDKKANTELTQGGIYLGWAGSDLAITWEKGVEDTLYITLPQRIFGRYGNYIINYSTWANATQNMSSRISINGEAATITIDGLGKRFVYNLIDGQFYVRNRNEVFANDVCLMVNGYGTPCGGELMQFLNVGRFKAIENDINTLQGDVANINGTIADMQAGLDEATRTKIKNFATMFNNTDNIESFLFFTDPHLTQFRGDAWRPQFNEFMGHLKSVYDEVPVTRVFCGGDWMGNKELPSDACYRLGLVDATMRANFGERYHLVAGNHDYNAYGCSADGEAMGTGLITPKTIRNLWYRDLGKNYYKIESQNTDFYVFDSQDSEGFASNEYTVEQAKWFAACLQANARENIAIVSHFVCTPQNTPYDTTSWISDVAKQFNARSTITIYGTVYDFSNATGKVRFWMQGHEHEDYVLTHKTIPVIVTTDMRAGGIPTYDLCLANYDTNKLHLVRIGTGEDRVIDI